MLGQIIERVSGMKFEEYVRENILDPLDMKRSGFLESHISKDDNVSVPYEMLPDKDEKPKPILAAFPFSEFILGPGGLISSINEMSNYIIMMMNGGKFKDTQLLDSEKIEEMFKFHFTGNVHSILSAFPGTNGYGYGWSICNNFLGNTLVQHDGGITGGYSIIGFIKELKLGFAAIGNASSFPVHQVYGAIALLMGKDPDKDIPFFVRDNHFNKLCGEYISFKEINKLKISNKLGVLHLETTNPLDTYPLFPSSDDHETLEYYMLTSTGVKMPVIFRIDDKAKPHFTLERNLFHKV